MGNMSIDSPGLVSLAYILANIKSRLLLDDKQDERILQMIIDCITELNAFHLDITGNKTTVLQISQINTVDLPIDYIDYVKIGYILNGRIVTLSYNPDLAIPITEECGDDTNPFPELPYKYPVPVSFGSGGGYNVAEYRVDRRNGRIVLSGVVPTGQIALEYISSGISFSEDTIIPKKYVPAIRAYVTWQLLEYDHRVPMNDKMRKGDLYAQEVRRVSMSEMPTLDEIMDAVRRGYRQTIKR